MAEPCLKKRDDLLRQAREILDMWYAIQVMTGNEQQTAAMCRTLVEKSVLLDIFFPETESMKRYHGSWHKERKPLFSGYLFAVTDQPNELYLRFKRIPKLTKLLGTDQVPVELTVEETRFLQRILNPEHVAEMSTGILEGDRLVVNSGPLKGMEGFVKKINRHKKIAIVGVDMFGREIEITLGLEVLEKLEPVKQKTDTV